MNKYFVQITKVHGLLELISEVGYETLADAKAAHARSSEEYPEPLYLVSLSEGSVRA